jgi:ribonuclease P protein component
MESEQPYPAKVLMGVKKKTHRRAVQRNLIKRRSREAYRKQKADLYDYLREKNMHIHLGLIYVSTEILDYKQFETAMEKLMEKLKQNLEK